MPSIRTTLVILALPLVASGCSPYDPPVQGDHTASAYQTNLEKCRTDATEQVRRRNAATPGTWIISPFTGPPAVRTAIRTCMVSKGYTLQNSGG